MYQIYFKQADGHFRILCTATDKIFVSKMKPKSVNAYAVFKGYEATDEGLRLYYEDFKKWCTELKDNKILSIVYDKYFSHDGAVECTFKRLCKGRYEHHEPISAIEGKWSDMCNNGGLMYCKKGLHQSFGYDGKNYYGSILGNKNFKIPTREGKEVTLEILPKKLEFGYYKVKITSNNDDFKKIFAFSQHHVYTHTSLQYAIHHKHRFDVQIELIQNGKPNSYLYDEKCIISSSQVFGKWFDNLNEIRKIYPKNKLIKHLLSSAWGHLSRSNRVIKTYEEILEEELKVGKNDKADYIIEDQIKYDNKEYYVLVNRVNPYKYNLRLKSFITAFGRIETANVALLYLDAVVRVQTDNVTFNKFVTMTDERFVAEEKTTGLINWLHVNDGKKQD